jgi:hypothetical protein
MYSPGIQANLSDRTKAVPVVSGMQNPAGRVVHQAVLVHQMEGGHATGVLVPDLQGLEASEEPSSTLL